MRYLLQLIVPALIFVVVLVALTRRRREPSGGSDTGTFLGILAISAVVAVATAWLMVSLWG